MSEDIVDVVSVEHLGGYRLRIGFEDGQAGEIDVKELLGGFQGVFTTLEAVAEFAKAYVDPEVGSVCWPNGADLDPCVLYAKITGTDAAA